MTKKIITVPNSILRAPSTSIAMPTDHKLASRFAKDLEDTLLPGETSVGIGLALPQIGKNSRVFVTYLPESCNTKNSDYPTDADYARSKLRAYINPLLVDRSDTVTLGPNKEEPILEGCLSIPGIYGAVPRHEWVALHFMNEQFEEKTETFSGFFARVIQHEYDHLEGILFTDYVVREGFPLYHRNTRDKLEEIDPNLAKTW